MRNIFYIECKWNQLGWLILLIYLYTHLFSLICLLETVKCFSFSPDVALLSVLSNSLLFSNESKFQPKCRQDQNSNSTHYQPHLWNTDTFTVSPPSHNPLHGPCTVSVSVHTWLYLGSFFFKGFIIWDLRGRKATAPQKYDVWFISKCVCVCERVHTIPAVTTCQTHSNQRTSHLSVERPLIPSSLTKSQSDLAARPWRNIQDTVCSRWAYTMKC